MPLMVEEPPSTRPRGQNMRRPAMCGSGSVKKRHRLRSDNSTRPAPSGTFSQIQRSSVPASSSSTRWRPLSLRRAAIALPADPPPTIT